MNSIVADPVSDQTDCQAVCNGDDTEVNRKDCAVGAPIRARDAECVNSLSRA
jgi:hypothetical protein